MPRPILSVKNLCVNYPSFKLQDVSFDLHEGEIIGLIGENGAGKSTTIKAIMGMIDKSDGEVCYHDKIIKEKDIPEFRQDIGYVGDAELYYAKVKVKQILRFLADLYDDWDDRKMQNYLEAFKLDKEKKIIELSMGMRVKLEIIIALSHHAEIYILDEPTSGLDPIARKEVLNILDDLRRQGKSILFSSHITSDLDKIADRVIYMINGHIELDEKTEVLKERYENVEEVLFALSGEAWK